MLNFTVGPVQANEDVCAIGAQQVPYFRTAEFSETMLENERILLELAGAPKGSRAVFLTGSGTAAMEAAVMNTLDGEDRVLVVDGGSFGHRFVELLQLHGIPHTAIHPEIGYGIDAADLTPYENAGYTAFVVNLDETSTGVLYDIDLIGDFCKRNGTFLIVDAISAFLADPIDMIADNIDVMITGSQKALAVPPGVSVLALGPRALERINRIESGIMYLDLKIALKNGERGQTPFTPAVGTLLQINCRLKQLEEVGLQAELDRISALAADFRARIGHLPFKMFSHSPATAVTSLEVVSSASAKAIFTTLKDEYGIWICPNGGDLAERVFRVGHIGNLSIEDNATLVAAFDDLQKRGLLG